MVTSTLLETAIRMAVNTHYGKTEKSGEPYIFHLLRVMNSVDTVEEKVVAILHGMLNDSLLVADRLREQGIPEDIMQTLQLLASDFPDSYEEYIQRVADNPLAKAVKIADLKDSINLLQQYCSSEREKLRMEKYSKALQYLMSV